MKAEKTALSVQSRKATEATTPAEGGFDDRRAQTAVQRRIVAAADRHTARVVQRKNAPVMQLLSEEQEGELAAYALQKIDDASVYVPETVRKEAVSKIAAAHSGVKPRDLANAKTAFDQWLKAHIAERAAAKAEAEKNKAAVGASSSSGAASSSTSVDGSSTAPAPTPPVKESSSSSGSAALSAPEKGASSGGPGSRPAKPKAVKMSLGEFRAITPSTAPTLNFGAAAAKGATMPATTSVAPSKPAVKASAPVIAQLDAWKPSKGHGGCNGTSLSAADLQDIVDWADSKGKYFVKSGAGTGAYSDKLQLKIIHKTVDDKPSGKKATFHIRASEAALNGLSVERSDDY